MKAISVYALTREQNIHHLQKLERQLSERDYFLKIKEWELNSMKGLVKQLEGSLCPSFFLFLSDSEAWQRI